ncbi:MAG: CAP domain-containing protein, partial [Acidimicrobiia bacterium]
AVSSADAARRLLDLANAERSKSGLGALAWRDDVATIALAHSQRMAQAGDIFHSDSFFGTAVKKLLNAVARGENVAYNGSIESAHSRLMASSGHRANILDARFSVAGFGVVRHADGRYFITQNFIQPAGAPASAAPRPVAAPAPRAAPRPAPAKPAPTPAPAPAPAPTTTEPPAPTTEAPPAVADNSATLSLAETAPEALTVTPAASSRAKLTLAAAGVLVMLAAMALACWAIPRRFRS